MERYAARVAVAADAACRPGGGGAPVDFAEAGGCGEQLTHATTIDASATNLPVIVDALG